MPTWLPDGSRIIFARGAFNKRDLLLFDRNSRKQEELLKLGESIDELVMSPDGKQAAMVIRMSDGTDLKLLNLETRKVSLIVADGKFNGSPAWAPDGRSFLFSSFTNNHGIIKRYDVASGQVATIVEREESCSRPSWAPDGRTVAIAVALLKNAEFTGGWTELIDLEGKRLRKLGEFEGFFPWEAPQWSSDGAYLAVTYSRVSDLCHDLFVLGTDGKGQKRLTDMGTNLGEVGARWRPGRKQK